MALHATASTAANAQADFTKFMVSPVDSRYWQYRSSSLPNWSRERKGHHLPSGCHSAPPAIRSRRCGSRAEGWPSTHSGGLNLAGEPMGGIVAGVSFPSGVGKAALNVPHLAEVCPTPPSPPSGPLPIHYPNMAHFGADGPARPVVGALFHVDIDVIGAAPPIDHWLV